MDADGGGCCRGSPQGPSSPPSQRRHTGSPGAGQSTPRLMSWGGGMGWGHISPLLSPLFFFLPTSC